MDRLSLNGVEEWVRVGCTKAERAFPQPLTLDVSFEMDLAPAGRTDDLSKTLDYAAFLLSIRGLLKKKSFRLIESVAETVAGLALKHKKVWGARVVVRKKALPGMDHAAVDIHRVSSKKISR